MKIALFSWWGASADNGMVPEGCPKEYAKYENRHRFAEWLAREAVDGRPYIVEEWEGGAVTYEYLYISEKFPYGVLVRVSVVEVDQTRPWLIHNYDGWEQVWYLDKVAANGQILPDIVPEPVGSYRYGEKDQKIHYLFSLMPGIQDCAGEDDIM